MSSVFTCIQSIDNLIVTKYKDDTLPPRSTESPSMDKVLSLCKRRGFLFRSSEIYGGLNSTWDYGPLGVELKRNVKESWWRYMVHDRDNVVGLDSAILMHPQIWVASGHKENFSDPLVECKDCHQRFKVDDDIVTECLNCGGEVTAPRQFNLMFKTFMGPVEDTASEIYLRPETAQGIFVNFQNVVNSTRKKLPFGIAQIGKAFRNEITPGNSTFRTREFEQMEIEIFVKPGSDEQWLDYWVNERFNWYVQNGIRKEHLRIREHGVDELAHYAKKTFDIEYLFPWGWAELEGVANRSDFDLKRHSEYSGQDLTYFDDELQERYFPYVIEPSGGVDRAALAFLLDAYDEEEITNAKEIDSRVVLRFSNSMAPVKIAVLPLSRNDKLSASTNRVLQLIRPYFATIYDDSQSIGRRYRRQDEIGTPLCVTVDFQTVDDAEVTIRDRDSMNQIRVPIDRLLETLRDKIDHGWQS